METNKENQIIKLLDEYASALSAGAIELIPGFYAEDGLFMPNSLKNFSKSDFLIKSSGIFLKTTAFKIKYAVKSIVMDDNYAFVSAIAETSTRDSLTGNVTPNTTRDFFVLRKTDDDWKIYRYMFNDELRTAG